MKSALHHLLRTFGLYLIPGLVIYWLIHTDPDGGASTRDMLQGAASAIIGVTLMHITRRFVMPYVKLEKLLDAAMKGSTGAGIAFAGVMLFMAALLMVFAPRAHAGEIDTYVPAGALKYGPVLRAEQVRVWPAHSNPAMLAALVEQESCITLHSPSCWSPTARNSAPREEGASFGQVTRTWRVDGTLRFDALAETRKLDPGLSEWSWSNVYTRPDLSLRSIVVIVKDCDRRLAPMVSDPQSRLEMCDAAYNGGYGGMQADRRACGQRVGCDPQRWFKNVELTCTKSSQAAAGYKRGPCVINREHVENVAVRRRKKYMPLMAAL